MIDLTERMSVRIVGGPWRGHRGLITALPENVPGIALVAVLRQSGPSRPAWDVQPVASVTSYAIARTDLEVAR